MLRLSSLARIVVQRQRAASRSAIPCIKGQQVAFACCPIPICISPPRRSTHAFSFNVSIGHVAGGAGTGVTGGAGGDGGRKGGVGGGGGHGTWPPGGILGGPTCGGGLTKGGGLTMGGMGGVT